MPRSLLLILLALRTVLAETTNSDTQFLNELPLDKLLKLKNSLQSLVTTYDNVTTTVSPVDRFGAQAMALKTPIKRGDYEEEGHIKKGDEYNKMSHVFSASVTTLAFLAFGGYLLCLIVQAVKAKQMYSYNQMTAAVPTQATAVFLANSIKKRPQVNTFTSYGRRKRDASVAMDLPPDQLFAALLSLCEGYAKWNRNSGGLL